MKNATAKKPLAWDKNMPKKREHLGKAEPRTKIPQFEEAGRKLNILMQITDPMLGLADMFIAQLQMLHKPREASEEQKQQAVDLARKKGVRAANQFLKQCSVSEVHNISRKTSRSFFFQYLMWLGLVHYAQDSKSHTMAVLKRDLRAQYDLVVKELEKQQKTPTAS